jgi:hypothetical protein
VLRNAAGLAAGAAAAYILWPAVEPSLPDPLAEDVAEAGEPLRIGATFSPVEPMYIGADWRELYRDVLALDLDYLRLGAYWNDIERQPGEHTYETLDFLLDGAAQRRRPVTLTVGLKAPVYPEFHIPDWALELARVPPYGLMTRDARLRDLAHRFTQRAAEQLAGSEMVERFQVENEPFEPVLYYKAWSLDRAFLRRQVDIVRAADPRQRKIVLTASVATNTLLNMGVRLMDMPGVRHMLWPLIGWRMDPALIRMADVVGLDVYPGLGWRILKPVYFNAWRAADYNLVRRWKRATEAAGKQVAIMEAQAKPWEPDSAFYLEHGPARSFSPDDLLPFLRRLVRMGFRDICLWGVEHWAWHFRYGDRAWWNAGVAALRALREG